MTQRSLWSIGTSAQPSFVDERPRVDWVCRKDSHRRAPSRGGRGGLTVHRGRWAYCDGLVDDPVHEWVRTGGAALESLVDWAKALNALRAPTAPGTVFGE